MPLPDLLLGTRRLRRDASAHAQQLERDVAQLKCASAQLRHTAIASVTSPLGLLSAVGAGFIAGKIAGRPSQPKPTEHHKTIGEVAALALNTARSMSLQILLPLAAGWLQSKFFNDENDDNKNDSADNNIDGADTESFNTGAQ